MKFEQSPIPSPEKQEKKTNIIEAITPDGEKIVMDVENEINQQYKFLKQMGYQGDAPTVEITEKMRQVMKEAIEKGFTELVLIPDRNAPGGDLQSLMGAYLSALEKGKKE